MWVRVACKQKPLVCQSRTWKLSCVEISSFFFCFLFSVFGLSRAQSARTTTKMSCKCQKRSEDAVDNFQMLAICTAIWKEMEICAIIYTLGNFFPLWHGPILLSIHVLDLVFIFTPVTRGALGACIIFDCLSHSQITCGNVLGKHQILDGSHSASRTFFISLCTSDFLVYSETLLSNIWLTFILLQQVNKNKHNQKNFKSNIVINKSRFFLFCSQWNSLISYFYWQAVQNNMS